LGDFKNSAKYLDLVLTNAKSVEDRGRATIIRVEQFAALGKYVEAVEFGIQSLKELGIHLPNLNDAAGIGSFFGKEYQAYLGHAAKVGIAGLYDLPISADAQHRIAITILATMLDCTVIGPSHYLGVVTIKCVNECFEKGNTPFSPFCYIWFSVILTAGFQDYQGAYQIGELALRLNDEKIHNKSISCKLLNMFGAFINCLKQPAYELYERMERSFQEGMSSGDQVYGVYSMVNSSRYSVMLMPSLTESLAWINKALGRIAKLNNIPMYDNVSAFKGFNLNFQGLTSSWKTTDFDNYSSQKYTETYGVVPLLRAVYWNLEIIRNFFYGQYEDVIRIANKYDLSSNEIFIPHAVERRLFTSLAYIKIWSTFSEEEKIKYREAINANYMFIEKVAAAAPVNFAPAEKLLAAEISVLDKKGVQHSIKLYEESIEAARQFKLYNYMAIANEQMALMWLTIGAKKMASYCMVEARQLFSVWGAQGKVKDLNKKYSELLKNVSVNTSTSRQKGDTIHTTSSTTEHFDLMAVLTASQVLSEEIHLQSLLKKYAKNILLFLM